MKDVKRKWKTLDLFCGCGGLTEGFRMAGDSCDSEFECVGAMDNWQAACDAFSLNHPIAARCDGVSSESVSSVLDQVGDIDVVVGGPPCQGFSTVGKRALDDPRSGLVKSYFEAIKIANPKAFVMENVVGFTNFQSGKMMSEVIKLSRELGYQTHAGILLASLCGVPQRRRRFFLVGIRSGDFLFPNQVPSNGLSQNGLFGQSETVLPEPLLVVNQRVGDGLEEWSFDDAVSDLPLIEASESASHYRSDPQNSFQEWARRKTKNELSDHFGCKHRPSFIEMMKFIPQGRSAIDPEIQKLMPESLRPTSGFPNSYARIIGSDPSPTITRNFTTPSSATCIHPTMHRALTLREGARCQSFPDHYEFTGTHGDRRLMIGNSVPPLLAKELGIRLLRSLEGLEKIGSKCESVSAV